MLSGFNMTQLSHAEQSDWRVYAVTLEGSCPVHCCELEADWVGKRRAILQAKSKIKSRILLIES